MMLAGCKQGDEIVQCERAGQLVTASTSCSKRWAGPTIRNTVGLIGLDPELGLGHAFSLVVAVRLHLDQLPFMLAIEMPCGG